MRSLGAPALLLIGACATAKAPPRPAASPPTDPSTIPADFKVHLEDAEEIGQALYQNDQISALGTDVLMERVGSVDDKSLGGYLTLREGTDAGPIDSWAVEFFTRDEEPRIRYRVRIARGKKPELETLDPPAPAGAGQAVLIRARRTALAHLKRVDPPRQPINPVILPGEVLREQGILVYLLAGTTRRGVAVMGKHHRVLLSSDGSQVLRFEPLTKSVMEIEYGDLKPGEAPAAIMVSHIVTEWPLETHVFTSLLHKQPVYVACSGRLWKVDGAKITLLPQPADHPDPQHHAYVSPSAPSISRR